MPVTPTGTSFCSTTFTLCVSACSVSHASAMATSRSWITHSALAIAVSIAVHSASLNVRTAATSVSAPAGESSQSRPPQLRELLHLLLQLRLLRRHLHRYVSC